MDYSLTVTALLLLGPAYATYLGGYIPPPRIIPGPAPPPRPPAYQGHLRPPGSYDPDLRPPPPPPPYAQQPWSNYDKGPWYGNQASASFQGGPNDPYKPQYNQIHPYPPPGLPLRPPGPQGGGGYFPPPPPPPPVHSYNNPLPSAASTLPPSTPKPLDDMADVANHLGTRILFDHASARGNFVFSPYGATSVLTVLTEGSSGVSSRQLATALDLPRDLDAVRVGMRDLHRHLKSYFGHNGFLQGVDLSTNNTSLRSDFVPILRLYGYHVDSKDNATVQNVASEPPPLDPATTVQPDESGTEAPDGTEGNNNNNGESETTTQSMSVSESSSESVQEPVSVSEPAPVSESSESAAAASEQVTQAAPDSVTEPVTDSVTESGAMQVQQSPSTTPAEPALEVSTMDEALNGGGGEENPPPPEEPAPAAEEAGSEQPPEGDQTPAPEQEERRRRRRRRSTLKAVQFPDIELHNGEENGTDAAIAEPDPNAPRRRFRLFNGEFTRPLPVLERLELLPFASLPRLRAVASMLPLEDPRYGLLVLLPTDGRGPALKQLAQELTVAPLRIVLNALRLSRVRATIPAFAAKGTVVLTSSLQQLGVWDVFDPRLARLDKMSSDPGLFVRELEQTVRVDFGNIKAIQTRVVTARSAPEILDAMRPFLYFVMDKETRTALLAGKVEDPSTARIF